MLLFNFALGINFFADDLLFRKIQVRTIFRLDLDFGQKIQPVKPRNFLPLTFPSLLFFCLFYLRVFLLFYFLSSRTNLVVPTSSLFQQPAREKNRLVQSSLITPYSQPWQANLNSFNRMVRLECSRLFIVKKR